MTPDDKKDLIMPSLDRRAKRKIVVFLLFVYWQVGKKKRKKKKEKTRQKQKKMKQGEKKRNKVSYFNLKRR